MRMKLPFQFFKMITKYNRNKRVPIKEIQYRKKEGQGVTAPRMGFPKALRYNTITHLAKKKGRRGGTERKKKTPSISRSAL